MTGNSAAMPTSSGGYASEQIDLHVQCLNGEGCILKLNASVLGWEVYQMVCKKLGPKKAAKPALHHLDSLLMLCQTLEEQGIRGKTAILTCTYVPTDLYAAWCHIQGLPVFEGELALEGVTEIANTSITKSLHNLPGSREVDTWPCFQ